MPYYAVRISRTANGSSEAGYLQPLHLFPKTLQRGVRVFQEGANLFNINPYRLGDVFFGLRFQGGGVGAAHGKPVGLLQDFLAVECVGVEGGGQLAAEGGGCQAGLLAHFAQGGLGRVLSLLYFALGEVPAAQTENHQHLLAFVHNNATGGANRPVVAGKRLKLAFVGDIHGRGVVEDSEGKMHALCFKSCKNTFFMFFFFVLPKKRSN